MQFYLANLEQQVTSLGMRTVMYASLILVVTTIVSILLKDRIPKLKLPLFIIMATTMIGSTLSLFAGTIYLNTNSESKGPVHWHTEVEFWACNAELELRDPQSALSNKVGTATFHEHNDKHVHLEGVVVRKAQDASLTRFMEVTGGYLTEAGIGVPLNEDPSTWYAKGEQTDGDPQNLDAVNQLMSYTTSGTKTPVMNLGKGLDCGSEKAELQVFVYHFDKDSKTYRQEKLSKPLEYTISDDSSLGPPSDCVIVEYDAPKARTNKLCEQYGVKDVKRCLEFGVKSYDADQCNIREVTNGGGL